MVQLTLLIGVWRKCLAKGDMKINSQPLSQEQSDKGGFKNERAP